jgi:hypothetical protein
LPYALADGCVLGGNSTSRCMTMHGPGENQMPDSAKPFVVYRRPTGLFTIVPRGLKGWAQLAVWIALLMPLVMWFMNHTQVHSTGRAFFDGLGLFCLGIVAWLIGGVWWMLARSEVVDMAELARRRYMEDRKRRRSR